MKLLFLTYFELKAAFQQKFNADSNRRVLFILCTLFYTCSLYGRNIELQDISQSQRKVTTVHISL